MERLINTLQLAMGSSVSVAVDYARWMFGCASNNSENETAVSCLASPFVYTRRSSMYYDEDGDLAHEFYEEISPPSGKPWMRRITENVFPQGVVKLRYPRLHVDFPAALYDG